MQCTECGTGEIRLERVARELSSDLPHVIVDGLELGRCSKCGETFSSFPRWSDLSKRVVAALLAKPSRLMAGEIRFLRQVMGLKAQSLAEVLGVTPSQISRWENGAVPISGLADRLFRMVVAAHVGVLHPDLTVIDAHRSEPLSARFELGRRGWKMVEGTAKAA